MKSLTKLTALSLTAVCLTLAGPAVCASSPAGKLTASVKAKNAQFATDERLEFVVTFLNSTTQAVTLDVTEYLGSQTAGKCTPLFRNVATGDRWQFKLQPSRWKPRVRQETIKPGSSLDLTYTLPGSFAPADNAAAAKPALFLPPGNYEMTLTIEAAGMVITPPPVTFKTAEVPRQKLDDVKQPKVPLRPAPAVPPAQPPTL